MAKAGRSKVIKIIMSDTGIGAKAAAVIMGCFAFCSIYLVLVSAVTSSLACLLSVFTGIAVVAVYLSLYSIKKYVKYIVLGAVGLYTVLCVAIDFGGFANGFFGFINNICHTANSSLHYGFASFPNATSSAANDYAFCSTLAAWLGLGTAVIIKKSVMAHLVLCEALTVLWVCLGLFPEPYSVVMLIISFVGLLMSDREFTFKSGMTYFAIAIAAVFAISSCFIYVGDGSVGVFKESVINATQDTLFGTDSLPEGKLKNASGMRSKNDERLRVTLSGDVRNLYLRGFVGSNLNGSVWSPTDKNAYVYGGYQGLLDYVSSENIPFTQYARYAALGGNDDSFEVEVENVGASRKYVYLPYTVQSGGAGSYYYDLNVKANVFTPRKYSLSIFAGDKSSEIVQQAHWLETEAIQTPDMKQYVEVEAQYRSFAQATYMDISDDTRELVRSAIGVPSSELINPVANFIRNFFRTYEYSDKADAVGDDFIAEFFGGNIHKANAAYFASAATIAFRAYDYAARYVEGYLVYADEGQTEVSVTGTYAHAWTEVYFDGIGWLPIEVSPGFFSTLDTEPDPDEPPEPIKPPDTPNEPDKKPDKPHDEKPEEPLTPAEQNLLISLKVLLPIACVALAALVTVLAIVVHRRLVYASKRKKLAAHGEQFGREVYGIMERDFGKDFINKAESYGIAAGLTARFIELVQKSVYGGYELTASERRVVLAYMEKMAAAHVSRGGRFAEFYGKYIKCVGI